MLCVYCFKGVFKKSEWRYIAVIFVIAYAQIRKVITKPFDCNIGLLIFSAQQKGDVSDNNFDILKIY